MTAMIVVGIVIVICGALVAALSLSTAKRRLAKRWWWATETVKIATHARLDRRFQVSMDERTSLLLAGAIVSALFAQRPGNAEVETFAVANIDLIASQLVALQQDSYLRHVITQTARVRATALLMFRQGTVKQSLRVMDFLTTCGLLVPGGEAPTPSTFLSLANQYAQAARTGVDPAGVANQPLPQPKLILQDDAVGPKAGEPAVVRLAVAWWLSEAIPGKNGDAARAVRDRLMQSFDGR